MLLIKTPETSIAINPSIARRPFVNSALGVKPLILYLDDFSINSLSGLMILVSAVPNVTRPTT